MPSIVAKTVRGRKYYQIVESRRVHGRPRSFVLAHLGRPETLLARVQQPGPGRFRSVAHGAVAALWGQATALELAALIDAQVPRDRRGRLPTRAGLTPGQTLGLAAIARACRPLSKRAFAAWARTTSLGRLAGVDVAKLTSQHFWDQMDTVPAARLAAIEAALVRRVVEQERIVPDTLFYDTTNFFTFIDSTNPRPTVAQRGHNKQQRHDLRQFGMALVVSREGQLPLFHLLYDGDRPDVRVFPEVLTSVRTRLEQVFGATPPPVTLIYDKGNVSRATQAAVTEGGAALCEQPGPEPAPGPAGRGAAQARPGAVTDRGGGAGVPDAPDALGTGAHAGGPALGAASGGAGAGAPSTAEQTRAGAGGAHGGPRGPARGAGPAGRPGAAGRRDPPRPAHAAPAPGRDPPGRRALAPGDGGQRDGIPAADPGAGRAPPGDDGSPRSPPPPSPPPPPPAG